jgi:hypothetical protein
MEGALTWFRGWKPSANINIDAVSLLIMTYYPWNSEPYRAVIVVHPPRRLVICITRHLERVNKAARESGRAINFGMVRIDAIKISVCRRSEKVGDPLLASKEKSRLWRRPILAIILVPPAFNHKEPNTSYYKSSLLERLITQCGVDNLGAVEDTVSRSSRLSIIRRSFGVLNNCRNFTQETGEVTSFFHVLL